MTDNGQVIVPLNAVRFEADFEAPLDAAVGKALETQAAAPLYREWSRLVDRHEQVGRGWALHLWEKVSARRSVLLEHVRQWQEAERVLFGTLTSVWSGLARLAPEPDRHSADPHDEHSWLGAVIAALEAVEDMEDDSGIESLDALLDLVARVFNQSSQREFSRLELWRGVVWSQAKKLSDSVFCRINDLLSLPDTTREDASDSSPPEVHLDVARLLLCLYADSVTPVSDPQHPVEDLAACVASKQALIEGPGRKLERMEGVAAHEIARLLRHYIFTNKLVKKLLSDRIGYKPHHSAWSPDPVGSVGRLSQEVLLLGLPNVGKSSFLFASEALCQPHRQGRPNAELQVYPGIELQHASASSLKDLRGKWGCGQDSRTDHFRMTAQSGAEGLCCFHFVDPPGELFRASQREGGGLYYGMFQPHVKRLDPSILVVMVSGDNDEREQEQLELENVLQSVLEPGVLTHKPETMPVFLVVNKSDEVLTRFSAGGADDLLVSNLAKALSVRSFPLGSYLNDCDNADTALRRLLDDAYGEDGTEAALREMVVKAFKDCESVISVFRSRGISNVTMTFTCSLHGESDETIKRHMGVNSFWFHLWRKTRNLYARALSEKAKSIFVNELKRNLFNVANLLDGPGTLRLDGMAEISNAALAKDLQKLPNDLRKHTKSILRRFGSAESKEFTTEIRRLLRNTNCDYVMQHADDYKRNMDEFASAWDKRLERLIRELNVQPEQECSRFATDELDERSRSLLRQRGAAVDNRASMKDEKSLNESQIDNYHGALRHSSVCRNLWSDPEPGYGEHEAKKWLQRGLRIPILKHVRDTITLDVLNADLDVSNPESVPDGQQSENENEQTSHTTNSDPTSKTWFKLSEVFWLISDYGMDARRNRNRSDPDYTRLTVRLWEKDRFLLGSLLQIDVKRRVEEVISLIGELVCIHPRLGPTKQIQGALMGFVVGNILHSLGFNSGKINDDKESFIQDMDSVIGALEGNRGERPFHLFRRKSLVERSGGNTDEKNKTNEMLKLQEYERAEYVPAVGTRAADVRRRLRRVRFVKSAVQACMENEYQLITDSDRVAAKVSKPHAGFVRKCYVYDENVRRYIDRNLKLLMEAHQKYLEVGGFLVLVPQKCGDALRQQIQNTNQYDWNRFVTKVVKRFSAIIDKLAGDGEDKLAGDGEPARVDEPASVK